VADDLVEEDALRGGSQVGTFAKVTAALVRFFRGETAASLAQLEEGLQAARSIQDPQALIPTLAFAIMCAGRAGDSGRVRELADEFATISVRHPVFLAENIDMVAEAMRISGMGERLAVLIPSAKARGPRPTVQVNYARAAVAEARDDLSESLKILLSVVGSCDQMSDRFLGTMARINAARVARLLGRDEDEAKLLDEAEPLATMMGAQRFVDEIAAMRGDGRKAAASGSRA
jgi:hypothetical protein